jgi:hypothetical protein
MNRNQIGIVEVLWIAFEKSHCCEFGRLNVQIPGLRNPEGIAIIQPKVARNELPWVSIPKKSKTLKGLHQSQTYRSSNLRSAVDSTFSGLKQWVGPSTQRSR